MIDSELLARLSGLVGFLALIISGMLMIRSKQHQAYVRQSGELDSFYCEEATMVATICKHRTCVSGYVRFKSWRKKIDLPLDENGNTGYCHECLSELVVPCSICGSPIFPFSEAYLCPVTEVPMESLRPSSVLLTYNLKLYSVGCSDQRCPRPNNALQAIWHPSQGVSFEGKGVVYRTTDKKL
jgi:hypothetical protein